MHEDAVVKAHRVFTIAIHPLHSEVKDEGRSRLHAEFGAFHNGQVVPLTAVVPGALLEVIALDELGDGRALFRTSWRPPHRELPKLLTFP
jgi:hypothetical protein